MATPTLAHVALQRTGARPRPVLLHHALLVLGFSAFVALAAQVSIPLMPVPITGQTLAVLLTGAALGSRLGMLSLIAYLAEGLLGLPVFAGGASAWTLSPATGAPYVVGPTLGYLVGFVASAGVVGWLAEHGWDRSIPRAVVAMVVGQAVIYVFGVAWLSRFVPGTAVLLAGVVPFLPGDAIKIGLAAAGLPGAWSLLGRRPER